ASVLERDVLPSRVPGYQPRLLDELGAMGEVGWVGRGSLGRDDGRIALFRPGRDALRPPSAPPDREERPADERHERIRDHLITRGASFYREIHRAAGGGSDREVLDALWDLVWAGEVTNDSFAALRAFVGQGGRGTPSKRSGRPRLGSLTVLGPPKAQGRWSLVEADVPVDQDSPTQRSHALATALLDRHGVLTRAAVRGEGHPGGFAGVYPVLRAMEESGRCRRGYFVAGLGGAQFALPGAVDRMRTTPADPQPKAIVLAATDPANPFGAALAWPDAPGEQGGHRAGRKAGASVVLVDGTLALYVEKGGRSLLAIAQDPAVLRTAVIALAGAARVGTVGSLAVERVNGAPLAFESPVGAALSEAGFVRTPKGLRLRV
ncbi:MAG TPA: DEAD/DEAH box helicase, partial [Actinomycetota bacterium]|nr:DEAD/DEAH box helicase [Actinomycetota bacterium]